LVQAAQRLGVTESAVRNATLEGRLPFVRVFGRKLLTMEALEEYRQRTQVDGVAPRGRPRNLTPKEPTPEEPNPGRKRPTLLPATEALRLGVPC
jgi:excisionase family DNA binding protein